MPSGGPRPGSGRKKKETINEQQTRRDVLLKVFSPERWERIANKLADRIEDGELLFMLPYLPYLLGSPKQEINVSGTVEHVKISEIRQAIGVPNIIELNAPKKAAGSRQ